MKRFGLGAGKPMHRTTDTGIKRIHDSEAENNTELYLDEYACNFIGNIGHLALSGLTNIPSLLYYTQHNTVV